MRPCSRNLAAETQCRHTLPSDLCEYICTVEICKPTVVAVLPAKPGWVQPEVEAGVPVGLMPSLLCRYTWKEHTRTD